MRMDKGHKISILGIVVLFLAFSLMYAANSLMPMSYGDDYLYSFVWEDNQRFFDPLPETAKRIESWQDCFDSLHAHYFSHSGRLTNSFLVFFFLWQGKDYFNLFNAILFVLLIVEIYWLSNRGRVERSFEASRIWWIFFFLWTFTIGFPGVFLWLAGACNYLWPAVLALGFLLPYVKAWHLEENQVGKSSIYSIFMFMLGVFTGCTNENTGCWIIILLIIMIWEKRKRKCSVATWEILGLAGFCLGYILLMAAPGNFVRMSEDMAKGAYSSDMFQNMYKSGVVFITIFLCQLPLWIFLQMSLKKIRRALSKESLENEIMAINGFAALSFCSNAIMIFSPEYPPRSSFSSLVYLIVAVCLAAEVQREKKCVSWNGRVKSIVGAACAVYVFFTYCVSFYGWGIFYNYDKYVKESVMEFKGQEHMSNDVLEIEPMHTPEWLWPASGLHAAGAMLKGDPDCWVNTAYARYYGIKGIRVLSEKKETAD